MDLGTFVPLVEDIPHCPKSPVGARCHGQLDYAPNVKPIKLDDHPGAILIEGRNCSSVHKHFGDITIREAQVGIYQEVSIPDTNIDETKPMLTKSGWAPYISCDGPETPRPTAGVATIVRHPGNA